jgi:allophanate hydrolase
MTEALSVPPVAALLAGYAAGTLRPEEVLRAAYAAIERRGADGVWIDRLSFAEARAQLDAAEARRRAGVPLPLYGVPFAIKDNMDVAGRSTTAACPAFAYTAARTATVVERLQAAGAVLVGKTNLDQFATGLVGIRSPYGAPASVYHPDYIAGGSSSGSAVAVAARLVAFALGTDTAGSGRVPAAFNGIVGLKPTRGLISAAGIVPACRSLDCVSIFTRTPEDARIVLDVARAADPADSYSREGEEQAPPFAPGFRVGVPPSDQREFFGDDAAARLYADALARLERLGGRLVEIDFSPFRAAAELLYGGPWVAERLAAIRPFFEAHPETLHPIVRAIIGGATRLSAADAFEGLYRLEVLRKATLTEWQGMDVLALPTTGTIYTRAQVEADPIRLNSNLGFYTNFVNLLDLAAIAVPAGLRPSGLPFGLSLIAPAFHDAALCGLGTAFATGMLPEPPSRARIRLAVVGAHLTGQPLNGELTAGGARLVRACRTAAAYRLFALAGTVPPRPGLIRLASGRGAAIEVEVWELEAGPFGDFVARVPPPLAIGSVTLDDGETVKGFICEGHVVEEAEDISAYGGWRAYLDARKEETS